MSTLLATENITSVYFCSILEERSRRACEVLRISLRAGESGKLAKPLRHSGAGLYVCTTDEAMAYYGRAQIARVGSSTTYELKVPKPSNCGGVGDWGWRDSATAARTG